MSERVGRVAIIGVGLIGGSFALALRQSGHCDSVVGAGRTAANLERAMRLRIIDEIAGDPAAAVRGADVVLVSAPVAQFGQIFAAIAPALEPRTLVMDAGSTKRDVVRAARNGLGSKAANFVPAHPIAGSERSGADAASAGLFLGKRVVLTPISDSSADAVRRAHSLWEMCGAQVSRMTADDHDAVFAAVSHLPHLLAYALVQELASRENAAELFNFAAGGFRDFTRIASSHPEMWRDICVANHDALLAEVDRYAAKLQEVRALLSAADGGRLAAMFFEARAARDAWLAGAKSGNSQDD